MVTTRSAAPGKPCYLTGSHFKFPNHFPPLETKQSGSPLLSQYFTYDTSGKWPQDLRTNKNQVGSSGHLPGPKCMFLLRDTSGAILATHWLGAGYRARGSSYPSPSFPTYPTHSRW